MDWTANGLWLVGIGSLAFVLAAVIGSPRPTDAGLRFMGPLTLRSERITFAVQVSSASCVAAGSLIVAIEELPPWCFALGSFLAAYAIVHGVSSWKLHQYWQEQKASAVPAWENLSLEEREKYPVMEVHAKAATECATWKWSLLHPFAPHGWPGRWQAEMQAAGRPRPGS